MALLLAIGMLSPPAAIYVKPSGNDANPGTYERPVATPQAAIDLSRKLAVKSILFRSGTYELRRSITLDHRDDGLTLSSAPNEHPILSGGLSLPVHSIRRCTDPGIIGRIIDPSARDKVLECDLAGLDCAAFSAYGFPRPIVAAPNTLYIGGRLMTVARWPNSEYSHVGSVLEPGNGEDDRDRPSRKPVFLADSDRPSHWSRAENAWLYGYWKYDWADEAIRLDKVDPHTGQITLATPHSYGVSKGAPFFAENLLEELDAPGEYFVDVVGRKLYFIPPDRGLAGGMTLSRLGAPLIQIDGATKLTIRGLGLAFGRADGVQIQDSTKVVVQGCRLYDLGNRGITVSGGTFCGARDCDIWNTGEGGVSLSGGDRNKLTPSHHFVEDCDIHDELRPIALQF